MGQLRLFLLLYYRPLRAMSGIIDEGSLLLAAGLVLVASFLTSAATASQVLRAIPSEASQAMWMAPGYDVGEEGGDLEVPRVEPVGLQRTFLGFLSATASLSTIFAVALLYAPFTLLLLTVFEPIGSFGVAFRSNFGPFLACLLMSWAAARIPFALAALVAPASLAIALLLWLASLLYFTALAACAARVVFGAGAASAGAAAALGWVAMALEPFLFFLASPFLLYYAYQFIRGDVGDVLWSFGARQDFKRHLQAATINPRDAEAHYQLGLIHLQRRQFEEAQARFARAVEIDPREVDAHYQLGKLAREQERYEDARRHFEAVVARDPRHASHEIWREVGATYQESGSDEHARWALSKFVEQRPHDPEGLFRLGIALARVGEAEPAGDMFRRCIEAVDTMPRYLRRKAGPWQKLAHQQLEMPPSG
jgi:tetratricopeptide (TPR) repeat protein